jgi:hypothetical protein
MELGLTAMVALRTYQSEGRPQTGWSTFGVLDRIRFPLPAASTTAAIVRGGCRVANGSRPSVRLAPIEPFLPAAGGRAQGPP